MQRTKVTGTRPAALWILLLIAAILVVGLVVGVLIVYPTYQRQQEVAQHYQAGVAFQTAEEWDKALDAFTQVIALDAAYKDAQSRLVAVKARQQSALATAEVKAGQATAIAQAQTDAVAAPATVEARSAPTRAAVVTATAQAVATAQAQQNQAQATAAAGAAIEAHYQKALGYINLKQWLEAQTELRAVFDLDPNYKEVQSQLAVVNAEVAKLIPTATPTPLATPTPIIAFLDDFSEDPNSSGRWDIYRYSGNVKSEAVWDPGNQVLYLTKPTEFAAVAIFAKYDLKVTHWVARFKYKAGGGSGADGFVFMFYKQKASYTPACGSFLGFGATGPIRPDECTGDAIIPGYGIEFDNNQSGIFNDPSPNYVALISNLLDHRLTYANDNRVEDNQWHETLIQFDKGKIAVTIDGDSVLTYFIPTPNYTYSGIGFSAGTGALTNQHVIDDFTLQVLEP